MSAWYRRDPSRFRTELALLAAATNAVPKWQGETLIADEDFVFGAYQFGIRIVFPEDFPNEPPVILLRYPKLPKTREVHRYTGGELCLLEPDEWGPRMSAASLRARAVVWMNAIINVAHGGEFVQPTRGKVRRA